MQRLKRGIQQSLSASTWGSFVDTAQAFKSARELGSPTRDIGPGEDRPDRVTIENQTGSDLRRGEVVQLGAFLLNDVRPEHPWFEGLTVDLQAERHTFGVMLKPTPADKFGKCLLLGACVARVFIHDTGDEYAELADDTPILASAPTGPVRILWKPSGETGEQECWVLLGFEGVEVHIGKTIGAHAIDTGQAVARWAGNPLEDTGIEDDVINIFANVADDKYVAYIKIGGAFYLISARCS